MAEKSIVSNSKLTAIADAIRSKTGETTSLTLDAMATSIANISTGTDTSGATAEASDILLGKTAYSKDGKITGTIEEYDYEGEASSSGSTLKILLDATKSCYYLFYNYTGTSVDDLISYSDTENVTNMQRMFYKSTRLDIIPQLDTSNVTNMSYMFYGCEELETIPQLNTSNVTSMSYMFHSCYDLDIIPQLDTSNVTNMGYMFYNCASLDIIPQLDTSNVTNMSYMVQGCRSLQTIPQLDTSNVTTMESMFYGCFKLQTIDITSMDLITSTSKSNYFAYGCCSLTKLIIRTMTVTPTLNSNSFNNCYHFTGTVNETYNPDGLQDGKIYVPDEWVEQIKQTTNWLAYADIIVPLSTLEE